MPWDKIERIYNKSLRNQHSGGGNKPARMVIGALIIKHKMNLSDEETIRLIAENPYMQYFIGLEEFTSKPVFDSSLFVYVRKRMNVESINEMSSAVMEAEWGKGVDRKEAEEMKAIMRIRRKTNRRMKMTVLSMKKACFTKGA